MEGQVREEVEKLLEKADKAHGIDHIDRVLSLSEAFAGRMAECVDRTSLRLTALLHDVDDYKLFGNADGEMLPNASTILNAHGVSARISAGVLANIQAIGFTKRLKGVPLPSIEASIVSDADLCDALGAGGIVRTIQYMQAKSIPFFVRDKWPRRHVTWEDYKVPPESTVCHIFEKLLHIKDFMQTEPGREEASRRMPVMEQFLENYFREVGAPEWEEYLHGRQ